VGKADVVYLICADQWYQHAHSKPMAIKAIARMVQSILYSHRFFPYYTYVILGGIDETDGKLLSQRQSSSQRGGGGNSKGNSG
jgi:20S proteasome alpha/beta subunit